MILVWPQVHSLWNWWFFFACGAKWLHETLQSLFWARSGILNFGSEHKQESVTKTRGGVDHLGLCWYMWVIKFFRNTLFLLRANANVLALSRANAASTFLGLYRMFPVVDTKTENVYSIWDNEWIVKHSEFSSWIEMDGIRTNTTDWPSFRPNLFSQTQIISHTFFCQQLEIWQPVMLNWH